MANNFSILDYFAKTNTSYLHANSKQATLYLMLLLKCQKGDKILEIGNGTGATLVNLATINKKTSFYGVEKSILMYKKASQRINFCLLQNRVKLNLLEEQSNTLPFKDSFFDKIYLESVLAINESDKLKMTLKEIIRVLKPKGTLIFNETIWIDNTNKKEINQLNEFCKNEFGIIQANSKYPYLEDWKTLLDTVNLKITLTKRVDEIKEVNNEINSPRLILSKLFTFYGKVKLMFNKSVKTEKKLFDNKINNVPFQNKKLMEGIIIKAEKV